MKFERLTSSGHPMYPRALEGYHNSFPLHEQRESVSQEKILADPEYHFNLIYENDTFVGALLCWDAGHFIYIEHLFILPEMRNQHYGEKALELLKRQSGKSILLEIDPPVDEVSKRRQAFYERCGFMKNPYPHVHPPYHLGNLGHDLVVLSCPDLLASAEYHRFAQYLGDHVMAAAYEQTTD